MPVKSDFLVLVAEQHVPTWRNAKGLNLMITGRTKCYVGLPEASFFNLRLNLATLMRALYKKVAVWIEVVGKQVG